MKFYELNYLIPTELSEEARKNLLERVTNSIQENGGILEEIKPPLQKNLNRPIKGRVFAYFINLEFRVAPEKIIEIEKKIRSEQEVLRYFITAKKSVKSAKIFHRRLPKKTGDQPKELFPRASKKEKVELEEIDKKLKEILGE